MPSSARAKPSNPAPATLSATVTRGKQAVQIRTYLSAIACFEYRPCFVTACRMRSMPSSVFGPVLKPPWSLHRPLGMAGHWQGPPRRLFAPQRLAFEKSPGGLPFLSRPLRWSWGVSSFFGVIPHPLPRSSRRYCTNDGLSAVVDVDVFHRDPLLACLAP